MTGPVGGTAMASLLAHVGRADVTPDPGGSPGFLGFVATFLLALAVIALMLSLTRHMRRVAAAPEPPEPAGAVPDEAPAADESRPDDAVPDEADGSR